MEIISWNDFEKVDMRVGTIMEANIFPQAIIPSYQLQIDFGKDIGMKSSSAQITNHYSKDDLIGMQVIAVVNFPVKQIANFMSECLVLGAVNNKDVILLQPERNVRNGLKIL